ncbi:MAG: FlgT C-terminal domain-containing protein [Pseudomonadota bacterium]
MIKINKHFTLLWAFFVALTLVSINANAAKRAKPIVAIKKAKIGEGVSKYSKKYLNLSTLWDEMEASIQKNRKFTLVSRKANVMQEIREEQQFANSDLSAGNAASEGQMQNANFLILSTVQDFKFYRSSKAVPNLDNKYIRRDSGMLELNVQVIDTSTGAIKTTFYLKSSFATGKKVVNRKGGVPNSIHFTKMAKKVAAQMTDQLVDIVFPMRVLNIQGNKVFINRGKDGGLKKGQILQVFKPGVALIDPDTGENLGSAETMIGKIKVTRINPKFTIAEITKNGMDEEIDRGDIVRVP